MRTWIKSQARRRTWGCERTLGVAAPPVAPLVLNPCVYLPNPLCIMGMAVLDPFLIYRGQNTYISYPMDLPSPHTKL